MPYLLQQNDITTYQLDVVRNAYEFIVPNTFCKFFGDSGDEK